MTTEDLLKKYENNKIKIFNSFSTKTIYDPNNLELIKKKYSDKFYGLKQGFDFMDKFLNLLKQQNPLRESLGPIFGYENNEVVVYDFLEKKFLVFSNEYVERIFWNTYLDTYFILDKNVLYIKIAEIISEVVTRFDLKLGHNFELGNIVNWFFYALREQSNIDYENRFSIKVTIEKIPEVFFEGSKLKHQEFMENVLNSLEKKKVINLIKTDTYEFLDIENSIRLIFGNFDMYWFNNQDKEFVFNTGFSLEDRVFSQVDFELQNQKGFFKHIVDKDFQESDQILIDSKYLLDYSNDYFFFKKSFALKIRTNNIIFGYTVSSMFCYLALHNFVFTNSLYSDFSIHRWIENKNSYTNDFWI